MADNKQDETNDQPVEQPAEEPKVEADEATTEEQPKETPQEESSEQSETEEKEEKSDIDLQEYWRERYQAPQQSRGSADEVAKEMANLPTDQYGNIDENAAAQWLTKKFNDVQTNAERRAVERAEQVVLGNLNEVTQQQRLLEKYPDLKRDRDTLDAVFDLRDAAALRGQNISLEQAAAKLDKLRQQGKAEGVQSATRRTTVQAAAHLESASQRGESKPQEANLLNKEDRHALLRQYVQKGIDSGEIQVP